VKLGAYLDKITTGAGTSLPGLSVSSLFADMDSVISPSIFQLIVGIYVMEVIIILGIFITRISHGENKTLQWNTVGKMLLIGMLIYFLVTMVSSTMFGGLIRDALGNMLQG
jgi:RsiW-degrading membrane proteinase PrsW (M82 family)